MLQHAHNASKQPLHELPDDEMNVRGMIANRSHEEGLFTYITSACKPENPIPKEAHVHLLTDAFNILASDLSLSNYVHPL
eukprot:scaffold152508_cov19-Prasinocladus_malaysianus.AAC.2